LKLRLILFRKIAHVENLLNVAICELHAAALKAGHRESASHASSDDPT
jgi:hypothetical protein